MPCHAAVPQNWREYLLDVQGQRTKPIMTSTYLMSATETDVHSLKRFQALKQHDGSTLGLPASPLLRDDQPPSQRYGITLFEPRFTSSGIVVTKATYKMMRLTHCRFPFIYSSCS
jgi:hypothetical protein